MKKSQSNKDQPPKKANAKDKAKEKQNIDKKEPKKENRDDISEEEYTAEEVKLLDKFHEFTDYKFDDDEIYDVMVKFHSDEELVKNELKQMLKDFSKGAEFNWTEIGKSE